MCFCFTKTLAGGMPPDPRNDLRAPCPSARSAGAGSPDGARGPRGHRQPFSRRERASTPFPWLDHTPRGCRVPRPEARNRGYSYPSGGRVRALQGIARPWIPPNRPPNAQNGRESGFPGSTGYGGSMTWMAATQSAKDPTHGRILKPTPVTAKLPAGGPSRDHVGRVVGHDGATLGRGPGDGVRGLEPLAARRSRGGPETPGSEGAQPPASLRRGRTECGPTE